METLRKLRSIHARLRQCRACSGVCGTPVHGIATETPFMLVGQAPGAHESDRGKPFAHTAGKTLFQWLGPPTGFDEEELRERIYISAVARCFPGKSKSGAGDREPSLQEIENCRPHLRAEVQALKPRVLLAVGRVAIAEVLGPGLFPKGTPLSEVVGRAYRASFHGHELSVIPLPHPSGVSRWPKTEPGKTKLSEALELVREAFRREMK